MRKRYIISKFSIKTIVLIIITIFFLSISVGYSYLKQKLNIYGKSTIVQQTPPQYEAGDSTYTWEIVSAWGGGTSSYVYQIRITVNIVHEEIQDIESIAFDVPDSYDNETTNIWIASSRTYEDGRLTLELHGWAGELESETAKTMEFQLAFTEEESDLISNLTVNGLLLSVQVQ